MGLVGNRDAPRTLRLEGRTEPRAMNDDTIIFFVIEAIME
jgi:hypothetical protein